MNKKLLIGGSAIAVVVLVLTSFSPVVGYNSVELSVKESPLFNVRTKRAINEESEILTCNYLRKGQLMSFPQRNSKTALIQKAINKISIMDDTAFNRFTKLIINRAYQDERIKNEDIGEIVPALNLLRNNPDEVNKYIIYGDKSLTGYYFCTINDNWIPGCFILFLLEILFIIIIGFPVWLISSLLSCWPRCNTEDCR